MTTYKIYSDGVLITTAKTRLEAINAFLDAPQDLPCTVEMVQEFTIDKDFNFIPTEVQ